MRMRVWQESWPLARAFKIAKSTIQTARAVVCELQDGPHRGRGECEVHESDDAVIADGLARLEELHSAIDAPGFNRAVLQQLLPACPIRNALDCALWELDASRLATPVWQLANFQRPRAVPTVYTLSVDTPGIMSAEAHGVRHLPRFKVKLRGEGDLERVAAVRRAVPAATLIADANESWSFEQLQRFSPGLQSLGVDLIEQPLPRGHDQQLLGYRSPVPLCADESCHDVATLHDVVGKYAYVNIKLDKTGGLTEAIRVRDAALANGLGIMVGCIVGTSLAMAPALLIAQSASYVDLDGPLLLQHDRTPGLHYAAGWITDPEANVWGSGARLS